MYWSRIHSRGRLPHCEESCGVYFVTFRLADSLPRAAILKLDQVARNASGPNVIRPRRLEEFLDSGSGACLLRQARAAAVIASALSQFNGARYRLLAWCVMPNHVHAVVQPLGLYGLSAIVQNWKSYSAHAINRLLKRTGALWQKEYYDHLIRNGDDLGRAIAYTAQNPTKAGLQNWPWIYVAKYWT
jgi:putative transposase